jgi:hypothetical protein
VVVLIPVQAQVLVPVPVRVQKTIVVEEVIAEEVKAIMITITITNRTPATTGVLHQIKIPTMTMIMMFLVK